MKQIAGAVSLLALLFLLPYLYADDPYFITGLMLALFLCFSLKKREGEITWNYVDAGVVLFLVYDWISLFFTPNLAGCAGQFRMTFFCVSYYFVLRLWCDRAERWRVLLETYVVCIGIFSLLALSYFFLFRQTVRELGFSDLYDFRFMLCPLGVVNNEWASLQLLFGGVVAVAWHYCRGRKTRLLLAVVGVLIFLQALWSFSRGVYLSLFLLSVGMFLLLWKRLRDRAVIAGILLFAVIAGTVFVTSRSDVMRTLKMAETVSQQRSIDTRLNTWAVTGDIVKAYPWGVGNGNYQIVADRYWKGEKGNEAYASYAMNLVSQLVVEKGWIGLLLYGGTFVLLCLSVIRKKGRVVWLAWLFLVVYLFREQTFSAFFSSIRVQWLFFTLLAVTQVSVYKLRIRYLSVVPVVVWLLCLSALLQWREKSKYNSAFLAAVETKDWNKIEQEAGRLGGIAPLLLNRALYYWSRYTETADEKALEQAKEDIGEARRLDPYDVQLEFYDELLSSADLELLAKTYPHKLMFSWEAYKQADRLLNREKSSLLLADCVLLDPRIMDTGYWESLSLSDPGFVEEVSDELLKRIRNARNADPVILAKMGSVALKLDELDWAEDRLTAALALLPNLSMAWFNLGVVKERKRENEAALLCKKRGIVLGTRAIVSGDGWKRYLHTGPQETVGEDVTQRIVASYTFRFQAWYGCRLVKVF